MMRRMGMVLLAMQLSGCGNGVTAGGGAVAAVEPTPSVTPSPSPSPSPSPGTALGSSFSCFLNSSGAVKCWGNNLSGQLGNGTTTNSLSPVSVSGLGSGVRTIRASFNSVCAILLSGAVKCWGRNNKGQLGDETSDSSTVPIVIPGLTNLAQFLALRNDYGCGVFSGGVKCWGDNSYGQLGDGTTTDRLSYVSPSGVTSGVSEVSTGYQHSCAVVSGALKCWGTNDYGQLGDGSTTQRLIPVSATTLTSGVRSVTIGREHTCVLLDTGGVKCWGYHGSGTLGDGTSSNQSLPVDVFGLTSGVQQIAAARYTTCALLTTGAVKCWGDNANGGVGDGTITDQPTPVAVPALASGVANISAGYDHFCAYLNNGSVKCWGLNDAGQLGDGTTTNQSTPVTVVGL